MSPTPETISAIRAENQSLRRELEEAKKEIKTVEQIWGTEARKFDEQIASLRADLAKNKAAREWIDKHLKNQNRDGQIIVLSIEAHTELRALIQQKEKK
jgi:predicted RNase H-like nuclease (RuvC/YqgF family)